MRACVRSTCAHTFAPCTCCLCLSLSCSFSLSVSLANTASPPPISPRVLVRAVRRASLYQRTPRAAVSFPLSRFFYLARTHVSLSSLIPPPSPLYRRSPPSPSCSFRVSRLVVDSIRLRLASHFCHRVTVCARARARSLARSRGIPKTCTYVSPCIYPSLRRSPSTQFPSSVLVRFSFVSSLPRARAPIYLAYLGERPWSMYLSI